MRITPWTRKRSAPCRVMLLSSVPLAGITGNLGLRHAPVKGEDSAEDRDRGAKTVVLAGAGAPREAGTGFWRGNGLDIAFLANLEGPVLISAFFTMSSRLS